MKLTLCGLLACAALATAAVAQEQQQGGFDQRPQAGSTAANEFEGYTIPFVEIEVGFAQPGLIREVPVKDGDVVKAGDLLAVQDDVVERAELAKEEFLLKSNVQFRAAEATRDLAEVELRRVEKMFKNKAASDTELAKAKVELVIAQLKVELAKEETETKRLEIERLKAQLDRMKIISPKDGIIRKVEAAPGEIADPQKPSIVLVVNDPVKIQTNLPIPVANTMKVGQVVQVRYTDEQEWREATIASFDPVANAEAGMQPLHLQMPNPEGRRAGQDMVIRLPEKVEAAAAADPKD